MRKKMSNKKKCAFNMKLTCTDKCAAYSFSKEISRDVEYDPLGEKVEMIQYYRVSKFKCLRFANNEDKIIEKTHFHTSVIEKEENKKSEVNNEQQPTSNFQKFVQQFLRFFTVRRR